MSAAGQDEENVATDFFVEMDKAVAARQMQRKLPQKMQKDTRISELQKEDTFLTQSGGTSLCLVKDAAKQVCQ